MNEYDVLKLKAVVLYILQKCGEIDYIHLFKILYFAEKKHYTYWGQHLIKDSFYAMEKGPVPSFIYDAVKVASGVKTSKNKQLHILADSLSHGDAECQYYYIRGKEEPDMDWLSEVEVETLDEVIDTLKGIDSATLSSMSHDEAWKEAFYNPNSSKMDSLLIAKAGGASEDFIEYLKEEKLIDEVLAN